MGADPRRAVFRVVALVDRAPIDGRRVVRTRDNQCVTILGEYEPSPWEWVRDQVAAYERSGGKEANALPGTDWAIVVVTTRGNKTGKVRKTALMRVEHDGDYALVASLGGAPKHPVWYYNLVSDPTAVMIQDGPEPFAVSVREVDGAERAAWWARAVAAYPPYAEYQEKTDRVIPVFVASRRNPDAPGNS